MSRHHEPSVLYQLAPSFELGEKQALLGFVRKGHVLGSGELIYRWPSIQQIEACYGLLPAGVEPRHGVQLTLPRVGHEIRCS